MRGKLLLDVYDVIRRTQRSDCVVRSFIPYHVNFPVIVFWLILPVVTCLSQRLSHACLSTHSSKVKPRMAH
jgi:hypothetical protein